MCEGVWVCGCVGGWVGGVGFVGVWVCGCGCGCVGVMIVGSFVCFGSGGGAPSQPESGRRGSSERDAASAAGCRSGR